MDTIQHADCRAGLPELSEKIHLTVTSPPYFNAKEYVHYKTYEEYLETLKQVFRIVYEKTVDGRMCCVNLSNILIARESRSHESRRIPLAFHFVPLMEAIGWKFIEDIVWVKPEGASKNRNGGFYQHRQPLAYKPNVVNEYIFVFQKPCATLIDAIVRSYGAYTAEASKVVGDYERSNVWALQPETRSKHPAPYPERLIDNLIRYYSYVGDIVLDPFMGSGTTAVSAKRLNRHYVGYEIHADYIEMANDRLKTVVADVLPPQISLPPAATLEELRTILNKKTKRFLATLDSTFKSSTSKSAMVARICEQWTLTH
jgi:hypothetical protein